MVKFLDLNAQYKSIQSEIDSAIADIINRSAFIGGAAVSSFEAEFARYQSAECCVGVGNGTDALEIAIEALELPPGSEIIVPANSFIASAEAVTRCGHKVVFADVDKTTYTLDLSDVRSRITDKTAAIIAVHLYGHPCDMDGLLNLAEQYDLKIIEDCAQAHGAEYKGHRIGALGNIGSFSFYPGKNLGAYGDGGAILTNDSDLADRCRMISNHGRTGKYDHIFEGRNSRLDGMQAAVLRVKLAYLDQWIERRNEIAKMYISGLKKIPQIKLPEIRSDVRHAFHLFVVRTEHRDSLAIHLEENSIQTGIHYPTSLPMLPAYVYANQFNDPIWANELGTRLLSLPMGEHLTDNDVNVVIETIVAHDHF